MAISYIFLMSVLDRCTFFMYDDSSWPHDVYHISGSCCASYVVTYGLRMCFIIDTEIFNLSVFDDIYLVVIKCMWIYQYVSALRSWV